MYNQLRYHTYPIQSSITPIKSTNQSNQSNQPIRPTIFISIASYRDPDLNNTIRSIFQHAKYPSRIYIGVCLQNTPEDEKLIERNRVRVIEIPHTKAKGPTYARFLCSRLYKGETYYMQIDSHMRFVRDWDELCINMYTELQNKTKNRSIILSHYPPEKMIDGIPVIENANFNENGILVLDAGNIRNDAKKDYIPSLFIAAGFFFVEAIPFLTRIPFDNNLDFLFEGEEILLSLRAYTHGYEIFTPKKVIMSHEYERHNKPKAWDDLKHIWDDTNAIQFTKDVFNGKHPEYLGSRKTREEFLQKVLNDDNDNTTSTTKNPKKSLWQKSIKSIIITISTICFLIGIIVIIILQTL
jgi:hypothetical protein